MRAARSMMSADLDAIEEVFSGYEGPFKISLCGPWTLAATIELPRTLNPVLSDSGAVADLTGSLAEATAAHVAEMAKRVPGADLVVQFDEPALAAVARGEVPTASGLSRLPAVDAAVMSDRLEHGAGRGRAVLRHSLLREPGPVRDHLGGEAGCGRLRPEPAAAGRSGQRRRDGRRGDGHPGRRGARAAAARRAGGAGPDGAAGAAVLAAAGDGAGGLRAAGRRHPVLRPGRRAARPGGRACWRHCREAARMVAELAEESEDTEGGA